MSDLRKTLGSKRAVAASITWSQVPVLDTDVVGGFLGVWMGEAGDITIDRDGTAEQYLGVPAGWVFPCSGDKITAFTGTIGNLRVVRW